ncbi:hypothetical protein AB1N83_009777 [Pleurotus pulmonarius]|nr:hypothetical protein EYR36_008062 [Pleurotus pulmonarius]
MNLSDFEEISALLSYKPPAIRSPTFVDINSPTTALSFYDMHLSSNLALQRVVYLPTLLRHMTKEVDTLLILDEEKIKSLPIIRFGDAFRTAGQRKQLRPDTIATDVASIAMLYEETTAANCQAVASTILLTPQCSTWMPAVTFSRAYNVDNPADQTFTLEEYSLSLLGNADDIFFYPEVKQYLSQETMQLLRSLWKKDFRLSTWEFLPCTSQAVAIIQNLCKEHSSATAREDTFHMEAYPPIGVIQESTATVPLDAADTPWYPHESQPTPTTEATASSVIPERHPTITLHDPSSPSDRPVVDQVLQHAWVTACRRDSTFIIFQCGNYERIGIRHRASQTLYLSDLISVPSIMEPGSYTKLHLGLYVSIIRDALDRATHIPQGDATPLPQQHGQLGEVPSARRQLPPEKSTTSFDGNATTVDFSSDLFSRNLLLVSLNYGVYCSPHPATFFRRGHQPASAKGASYKATEYVRIRLVSQGATGSVHDGTLEAYRENEDPIICRIVAKLALNDAQKERVKHEAAVYERLVKAGVNGIPKYYGLFEDPRSGHLMLVTRHEGLPLPHKIPDFKDSETVVPESWRDEFLSALAGIHEAGVCHKDVQADNLLVNSDDEVCIANFARASLTPTAATLEREYEYLKHILSGRGDLLPASPTSESEL